jgi:glycosyltransferase involved in cell wall biosynthesis
MHACTIAARNYLAHVRVLVDTFRHHHRDAGFSVLVVDAHHASEVPSDGSFEVLGLLDIGLGLETAHEMATIYDVVELATAVKPSLLRHLVSALGTPVTYLDPDIAFYAPITETDDLVRECRILLTPHVLEPLPRDGFGLTEQILLWSGMYNLGFIAVSPGALGFLDWWAERTRYEACVEPGLAMFTDQRWVDFAPALFDAAICRDPGWNVAYWNVHERPLSVAADHTLLAGASPLRFFHFSGFDPELPHLLSKHQGRSPRTLLSESPVLRSITTEYRERLLAAGWARCSAEPYRFGSIAGGPLPIEVRRLVREALLRQDGEPPPDPFGPDGDEPFLRWLNAPVARTGNVTVTRLAQAAWSARPDLRYAFPLPLGSSAADLMNWMDHEARRGPWFGHLHRPPRTTTRHASVHPPTPGINVVGYLHAELGIGEAARRVVMAAEAAGLPVRPVPYHATRSRQHQAFVGRPAQRPFDVTVLCVNADGTPNLTGHLDSELLDGRYRIGVWFWELETFRSDHVRALDHVDEVWVASDFVARSLRVHTTKPVLVFPLPVTAPAATALARRDLGLPKDRVLFYCSFDAFSVPARKNPAAVIRAYRRAFSARDGAFLLVKAINGGAHRAAMEELHFLAHGRHDIAVVDRYWSAQQMSALAQLGDVHVSLHRSEGFGLQLADAMAAGKPVIATGYSGNLDFMSADDSLLVAHRLVPVGPGNEPYPATARWAEPDEAECSSLMRLLAEQADLRTSLGGRARRSVLSSRGLDHAASWLRARFERVTDVELAGRQAAGTAQGGSR